MDKILSRRSEDYLEAIFNIQKEKKYARVKDISSYLNVRPSSVVEMLKRLNDNRLVTYRRHEYVVLTPAGEKIGRIINDRHITIREFLEMINVPRRIADLDACIIEHELHLETIEQIKNLVKFVKSAPNHPNWLKHFERFCENGKHECKENKKDKTYLLSIDREIGIKNRSF
ncbi:MAG: metal-dependent transcriptional regulator [Candidatus Methanoliparum thermophilum]|uniref:Metal-dependent transcriptional regulator n=1 Tax=Methanoliparum thermophilum TaxID=2491083 RepID=A0A520KTN3_METT2|nr:metal-dependent transcriptional regulator [Candidatus Methanoliparum sp. LAM-1]RZN65110.1 MAG: metal-dependent transcriptional regulator [Candidatus Methanoliparum thermophilum]BDC35996.1 iron-dependent repressor [Candidatus Methanoliparum sp. LAM-1]